jgi:beta-lactamase regulating signal transducer with metallopeptidase domain
MNFTGNLTDTLGWTLLHFVWQGAALALLLVLADAALRKASAPARYAAACTAMLLMLASAVGTFAWLNADLPASTVPVAAAPNSAPVMPGIVLDTTAAASAAARLPDYLPLLVYFWFAGVCALALRSIGGWVVVQRIKRARSRPVDRDWQDRFVRLLNRFGMTRAVSLRQSALAEVPAVIGWLRPVVLLPASALTGLAPQQLEALLAHELAHIRRHDYLVNLLQTAVETLLFYHPAVWWVGRRIRAERENCCDDLAVEVCGDALVYARALAQLEQLRCRTPQLAMASNRGSLLDRIQRLLTRSAAAGAGHWAGRGAAVRHAAWQGALPALLCLAALSLAAFAPLQSGFSQAAVPTPPAVPALPAAPAPPSAVAQPVVPVPPAVATSPLPPVPAPAAPLAVSQPLPAAPAPPAAFVMPPALAVPASRPAAVAAPAPAAVPAPAAAPAPPSPLPRPSPRPAPGLGAAVRDGVRAGVANGVHEGVRDVVREGVHGLRGGVHAAVREGVASGVREGVVGGIAEGVAAGVRETVRRGILYAAAFALPAAQATAGAAAEPSPEPAAQASPGGFIDGLAAAGYRDLSADDLIRLKTHGVTPEYARQIQAAGFQPTAAELVQLRIHGVTPEFIAECKAAGLDLDLDQLRKFRIHGVDVAAVKEMTDLGYQLSPDQMIKMRIHGLTPALARELKQLGLGDPSFEQLIKMRIHGVTPEYAAAAKQTGLPDLGLDHLIKFRIHGVDPEQIREVRELGFSDLSAKDAVAMRIHGVTPAFIREVQSRGFKDLSLEKIIKLKQLGILDGPAFI